MVQSLTPPPFGIATRGRRTRARAKIVSKIAVLPLPVRYLFLCFLNPALIVYKGQQAQCFLSVLVRKILSAFVTVIRVSDVEPRVSQEPQIGLDAAFARFRVMSGNLVKPKNRLVKEAAIDLRQCQIPAGAPLSFFVSSFLGIACARR